jgi:hypothetical protein
VDSRLDDYLLRKLESTERRADCPLAQFELAPLPMCERIAYERAVLKGLAELRASNPGFLLLEATSLYNVRE